MPIVISAPRNRYNWSRLSYGKFSAPCLTCADPKDAAAHGNDGADPLKSYGHTPLGRYRGVLGPVQAETRSYGPNRVVELQALDGDALKAARNGRSGIWIHGGDKTDKGYLRPTHGCVRLADEDMAHLISLLEATGQAAFTVEVVQAA